MLLSLMAAWLQMQKEHYAHFLGVHAARASLAVQGMLIA